MDGNKQQVVVQHDPYRMMEELKNLYNIFIRKFYSFGDDEEAKIEYQYIT